MPEERFGKYGPKTTETQKNIVRDQPRTAVHSALQSFLIFRSPKKMYSSTMRATAYECRNVIRMKTNILFHADIFGAVT